MRKMDGNSSILFKMLVFCGIFHNASAVLTPELFLKKADPCTASAVFEWQLTGSTKESANKRNCSVNHGPSEAFIDGQMTKNVFHNMSFTGSFTLHQLHSGELYSLQITCGKAKSDVFRVKINADDCGKPDDDDATVIEYKEPPSLLSGRDSLLGIVFGLFGFLIILVTAFIVFRKYRQRRRLERIHRYLGSSLIDPFGNLQLQIGNSAVGGSVSERLMGSTDSLT